MEVLTKKVDEAFLEDLKNTDAIAIGSPTYKNAGKATLSNSLKA